MPLLGVCRGFQVLNVARGGDLVQHLDDAEMHVHTPGSSATTACASNPDRSPRPLPGRRTFRALAPSPGIGRLGDGLVATGWAEPGAVVESIEIPDAPGWVLGILWHTEEEAEPGDGGLRRRPRMDPADGFTNQGGER